jgi:hypothetical protein
LRDPYSYCLENRLKAIKSPFNPFCWDHNQTVDATLRCYTHTGMRRSHCMQLSYSQNAFFSLCGSEFAKNLHYYCGTYIEIHRKNGSHTTPRARYSLKRDHDGGGKWYAHHDNRPHIQE